MKTITPIGRRRHSGIGPAASGGGVPDGGTQPTSAPDSGGACSDPAKYAAAAGGAGWDGGTASDGGASAPGLVIAAKPGPSGSCGVATVRASSCLVWPHVEQTSEASVFDAAQRGQIQPSIIAHPLVTVARPVAVRRVYEAVVPAARAA